MDGTRDGAGAVTPPSPLRAAPRVRSLADWAGLPGRRGASRAGHRPRRSRTGEAIARLARYWAERPAASGPPAVDGLKVEDLVQRIGEQLLPLLDRCNRLMLRNLRALRERRRDPTPTVSIASVGQVKLGARQVNLAQGSGVRTSDRGPTTACGRKGLRLFRYA